MGCNIILVGMPASGKTTIASLLSQKLSDYILCDTDSIIEKTSGLKIVEIFSKYSLKDGNTIKDIIKDMNIILSEYQLVIILLMVITIQSTFN